MRDDRASTSASNHDRHRNRHRHRHHDRDRNWHRHHGKRHQATTSHFLLSYELRRQFFVCTKICSGELSESTVCFLVIFFSFVAIPSPTPKTIKYEGLLRVITSALEGASDYHVNCKFKSPAMNPMEFVLTPCQRTAANIVQA